MTHQTSKSVITDDGNAVIESYIDGDGPVVVILPSYGRDSTRDFDDVMGHIVGAGWKVVRPQPRGVGGSEGPMTGLTLHDLANDIASCIRSLSDAPVVLLGHAFGHALSRMVATDHPELVRAAILAASQASKVPKETAETPLIVGNPSLPEQERLSALQRAFFAPNHDARSWLTGWYWETLQMQHAAAAAVPLEDYWACGTVPILEVYGAYDPFKPQEYWNELSAEFGDRVTSIRVEDAAHALFPEQPASVAAAIMPWLEQFRLAS